MNPQQQFPKPAWSSDIKLPAPPPYPTRPAGPLVCWLVRLVVEGDAWRDCWVHEVRTYASCSSDAVLGARADFYGTWASKADRERLPLRVLEVHQASV